MAGEISTYADDIAKVLKAHFMRQWMSKEGFMTELADVVGSDDEKKPLIDIYGVNQEHMKGLMLSALRYIKAMTPAIDATNTDLANLAPAEGSGEGTSSFDSGSSDGGEGDGGMDDFDMGGMDDLDSGEGLDGGEDDGGTAPEEEPTE